MGNNRLVSLRVILFIGGNMELEEAVLMSFNNLTHELSGIKDAINSQSLQMQRLEQSTRGEYTEIKKSMENLKELQGFSVLFDILQQLKSDVRDLKMDMKGYNLNREVTNLKMNTANDELKKEIGELKEIIANYQQSNRPLHCECMDVKVIPEERVAEGELADTAEVEFVSESQVSVEEMNEAQRLCLPAKFFAYRQLPFCECDQCVKDDEYFKGTLLEEDCSKQAKKYCPNRKEDLASSSRITSELAKSEERSEKSANNSMNLDEPSSSVKSKSISISSPSTFPSFGSSGNGDSEIKRNLADFFAQLRTSTIVNDDGEKDVKNNKGDIANSIQECCSTETTMNAATPEKKFQIVKTNDSLRTTKVRSPKLSLRNDNRIKMV